MMFYVIGGTGDACGDEWWGGGFGGDGRAQMTGGGSSGWCVFGGLRVGFNL